MELDKDLRSRQAVRNLAELAAKAQETLMQMSQTQLDQICEAIAAAGNQHAEALGKLACEETGFGNPADKAVKNRFASLGVMDAMRGMTVVGTLSEDPAKKTVDIGVPVGVIAGIVPSTNPTSTIFYKSLIALKSGNAIVFSPHPNALRCTTKAVDLVMAAAKSAGCPEGAISCLPEPTMDAIDELMHHPAIRLILATGGGAMVKAAYSSGKPAIGVGAGNGPAYLHASADVPNAIRKIIRSKTFDNGTVCASEQSIVIVRALEPTVTRELLAQHAYLLSTEEALTLSGFLLRANGTMNPAIVGKSACQIAKMAGLTKVPEGTTVLIAWEQNVGGKFPYSCEKLCPILAFYVEPDEDAALNRCCEILRNEGSGHTFSIHTNDRAVVEKFASVVPVSRILVNTPSALGGIGATTGLFPALTLGCGAVGGSSSSNNIGPLDLINIRRIAWDIPQKKPEPKRSNDDLVDRLVEEIMQRLKLKL
jgi:acetaldehyde dehydrogenase (acetylating)